MTFAWLALALAAAAQGLGVELSAPGRPFARRAARSVPALVLALVIAWAVWLAGTPGAGLERLAAAWWTVALPAFALSALGRPPASMRSAVPIAVALAAPAALLSFAPALAGSPWPLVAAGGLATLLPPAHAPGARAAEALPPGPLGLLLAGGLLLGGPPAILASAPLTGLGARSLAVLVALGVAILGLASASDSHLFRRLAAWCSVQAGLAVLVALLGPAEPGSPVATALAHLGASVAALVAMSFVLGRVASYVHVGDLAAYGGVLRAAVVRGQAVLAVSFLAVLASGQAPLALTRAALAAPSTATRAVCLLGLLGWFGASLAIVLAATRIARGRAGAPVGPAPEMKGPEVAATIVLFLAVVAAFVVPALWVAPAAWTRAALEAAAASGATP